MDDSQLRVSYKSEPLTLENTLADPFEQFRVWFEQAKAANFLEPNAMTLATATKDGIPSARVVLLKGVLDEGFVFYTNYSSRKGEELAENPHGALVFYWDTLHRQVRIQGTVGKVSEAQSKSYFSSRPRGSQIAATASLQSQPISDRNALEARWQKVEEQFEGSELPLADSWGGYVLAPTAFEFWQGQENRLHDRICYEQSGSDWTRLRLQP